MQLFDETIYGMNRIWSRDMDAVQDGDGGNKEANEKDKLTQIFEHLNIYI
jgi:hypothetical protein